MGVEIIPALNMPGHMGAILEHFPHLRYPGSRSSLNLGNPEAVAFGLALAEQYAAYFAGRGCRFFNFCADEFANDLGTMGLDLIYHNGDMKHFVSFVNGLAERIAQNGMVPMAFNDGIYYHDDKETYGTIDSRIWVQYWIAGWEGYRPASAATLAEAGFHLINANHRYYAAPVRRTGRATPNRSAALTAGCLTGIRSFPSLPEPCCAAGATGPMPTVRTVARLWPGGFYL